MNALLLQPASVGALALLVLDLVALGYLLSVRRKSRATWWLVVAFAGLSLFALGTFVRVSLYLWSDDALRARDLLGYHAALALFVWAYLQFAYRFRGSPFAREAVWAFRLSTALLAADVTYGAYVFFVRREGYPSPQHEIVLLAVVAWTVAVLGRRWRSAVRARLGGPVRRDARAFRAYTLLSLLLLVFLALVTLPYFGLGGPGGFVGAAATLCQLAFFFGLVVVYLNHAPEPTSVQVKLVGLALVTVLAVLVGASQVVFPVGSVAASLEALEGEGLRFAPDPEGGYAVTALPFDDGALDRDLGQPLALDDDTARPLALGFAFPFAGSIWDRVWVSPNGAVSFGAPTYPGDNPLYNAALFYNAVPKIAPLFLDLDPSAGGGVYVRRAADRVAITWHAVPQFGTGAPNTLRLVLHRDGTADFLYGHVHASFVSEGRSRGVRGLTPGPEGLPRSVAALATSLSAGLPYRLGPGEGRAEDYWPAGWAHVHREVEGLTKLMLLATAFVLLLFPLTFRSSLIRPLGRLLGGVRRLDEGDLAVEVPVQASDEIGRLTESFNRMAASLRRYSQEMEGLVAERTAILERALMNLQEAQDRLVQQEKLAGLGQLTAGIAHEIKNPLNFVNNFASLNAERADELIAALEANPAARLADVGDALADLRDNARRITEHGRRADAIVRSMMEHARGKPGDRRPVDLNRLVEEHVGFAFHGRRAKDPLFDVSIERDYDPAVGEVEVVPQDLGRVFLNLLHNAFDAVAPPTGDGQADGRLGARPPTVTVRTRRMPGAVEVRVEDEGPGIPEPLRHRIFEPFFTTKPVGLGTGLGLSLSHEIVVQGHGGTLELESAPGAGAAFVVTLPAA
jgi:signal transduction histidine kinase